MSVLCDFLQDGYCSKYTYNQTMKKYLHKGWYLYFYTIFLD